MTVLETPSPPTSAPSRRPPRRLPSSRGGVIWLIVLIVLGALLALQFGRQVHANWQMGQRADALKAEIAAVEAANDRLQAELDYVRSPAFIGAEARRLSNVGSPGEEALIIPPGAEAPLPDELLPQVEQVPLLEQWLNVFFGDAR